MKKLTGSVLALGIALLATLLIPNEIRRPGESLTERLEKIRRADHLPEIPCKDLAVTHPLVLLSLGQSNAGNHGSGPEPTEGSIKLIADGKCVLAGDPLPGATGTGGSIWRHLPGLLAQEPGVPPVVLSVLAVDATTIADWTAPESPLTDRLRSHIASMKRQGLPPDLVLWQQGEADARAGTTERNYAAALKRLADNLNKAGSDAPIVLARSTICLSVRDTGIRTAIEKTVASDHRFRLGPDTDTLIGNAYRNGCHLTTSGLQSAARMWTDYILAEFSLKKFIHH